MPQDVVSGSHPPGEEPSRELLRSYAALAGVFVSLTSVAVYWLRRSGRRFPKPSALDVLLLSLGTARLSRLITRDKVLRPLRAPFVATESTGASELREYISGDGMNRAVGELITCPRCTALWAANALSLLYVATPGAARFAGLVLSSALLSDVTNRSIAILDERHSG